MQHAKKKSLTIIKFKTKTTHMEILLTSIFIIGLALAFNLGMIKGKRLGYMECIENGLNDNVNENL